MGCRLQKFFFNFGQIAWFNSFRARTPRIKSRNGKSSENSICTAATCAQHAVGKTEDKRLRNRFEKLGAEVCSIETRLKFNVVLSRVFKSFREPQATILVNGFESAN